MANDPRAVVDFEGTGYRALSFFSDGSTITFDPSAANGSPEVGNAVRMIGDGVVGLTINGSEVVGRLTRVESDGVAVVQTEGGCSLPGGEGVTLTPGSAIVGALLSTSPSAGGGIRTATSPADALVARGQILDSSDSTTVKVRLD